MRANRRGPLTGAKLEKLRGSMDTERPKRRTMASLAAEMNQRIRILDIALVPANAWDVLRDVFGTKQEWSLSHLAAHLDVETKPLNEFMGRLIVGTARFDGFIPAKEFMDAARSAANPE